MTERTRRAWHGCAVAANVGTWHRKTARNPRIAARARACWAWMKARGYFTTTNMAAQNGTGTMTETTGFFHGGYELVTGRGVGVRGSSSSSLSEFHWYRNGFTGDDIPMPRAALRLISRQRSVLWLVPLSPSHLDECA